MLDGAANTGPSDVPVALRQCFGKIHTAIMPGNTSRLRFYSPLYDGLTCYPCIIGADIEPASLLALVKELDHRLIAFLPGILQSEAAATTAHDLASSGPPLLQVDRTRSLQSRDAPSPATRV